MTEYVAVEFVGRKKRMVVMQGMMYRTAVIIRKTSPDRMNLIRPEGTYFPHIDRCSIHYPAYYMVTCKHEKKTWHSVSSYNLFVTVHSVFQQRNIVCQTDAVSLLPLLSWLLSCLFLFLTGDNSAFCQELKSPYFPKIFKLMWNSSILVA